MDTRSRTRFDEAIRLLTRGATPRVWSLIVTFFGDLAQAPGDRVSGAVLTQLADRVEIKPEAMRVALHRLRKDGWIDSSRTGRSSRYFLTPFGRAQSAAASPRIYATTAPLPDRWHILIAGQGEEEGARLLEHLQVAEGYTALGPGAALGPGPAPDDGADLVVAIDGPTIRVPGWLIGQIFPLELRDACEGLHEALFQVEELEPAREGLTGLQVAALRVLIVHSWRRILLRFPDLPAEFHPPGWRGDECRARVARLLRNLPRPELPQIEAEATGR